MNKKETKIVNLGCRLNIFEGEVIKLLTKKNDINNYTIINSCVVTKKAEKKVLNEIKKNKKKYPSKKIILTGCAAQIKPDKYLSMPEVDCVVGNNEKVDSNFWKEFNEKNKIEVKEIFENASINNHMVEKFEGKARAYIEIQQGCNHRCTFCIIPFARGNNRSVPVGVIVNRIKLLVKNGYKEVVLTGVDITDYGIDLPGSPNLFKLVKRILNLIPDLKQLRLSSLDCAEINEDFWPLLNEKRLMPHFHISIQAGNDLILKRMKRRHTKKQVIDFVKKVRDLRKDAVFGADLIAGFPTEDDIMFKDSVDLVLECKLTHLHVFPYSERELTPASRMPQVSKKIIAERAAQLRKLGNKNLDAYLSGQIGTVKKVLIEQNKNSFSVGKCQHFTKIQIANSIKEGEIVDCLIYKVDKNISYASLI